MAGSAGAKGTSRQAPAARRAKAAGHFAGACRSRCRQGQDEAKAIIARNMAASKVAATALLTAIEMLEEHPLLRIDREVRLPLLTPFNSSTPKEIEKEVERRLEDGFRTFKIKVGKDADADADASRPSNRRSPVVPRCGSMPIAPIPKPMPAALPSRLTHRHRAVRAAMPCRRLGGQRQSGQSLPGSHHAG